MGNMKNRKIGIGKVENLNWKGKEYENKHRGLFSTFETTEICLGSTKIEIPGKSISLGKK